VALGAVVPKPAVGYVTVLVGSEHEPVTVLALAAVAFGAGNVFPRPSVQALA
jgi:hypothetical protein